MSAPSQLLMNFDLPLFVTLELLCPCGGGEFRCLNRSLFSLSHPPVEKVYEISAKSHKKYTQIYLKMSSTEASSFVSSTIKPNHNAITYTELTIHAPISKYKDVTPGLKWFLWFLVV